MHRAFESLRRLIADRYDHLPVCRAPVPPPDDRSETGASEDERIFRAAMVDVQPLSRQRCLERAAARRPPTPAAPPCGDTQALQRLIDSGEGFNVAQTPEYMAGSGPEIPPWLSDRVHRGDFAIQAHLDLHGFSVRQARPAFDAFLRDALARGHRAVLIIHGRGLSSPEKPVLKACVQNWLSRSAWRRWVLAFASARGCDGGAGATCVLLRERPLRRRRRNRAAPAPD